MAERLGKLFFEIVLQAGRGRAACEVMPAIRLADERRRPLLSLSPLRRADVTGHWQWRSPGSSQADEGLFELRGELRSAGNGVCNEIRVAVCDAALLVLDPQASELQPQLPRETLYYRVEPHGSGSVGWVCCYRQGHVANLLRGAGFWLLTTASRPAGLLYHRGAARLLERYQRELALSVAAGGDEPPRPVISAGGGAALLPETAAHNNTLLPFLSQPLLRQSLPDGAAFAPTTSCEVLTEAHKAAVALLQRPVQRGERIVLLRGEVGRYLLLARERRGCWEVAGITAEARVWSIWLPFLKDGQRYRALWHHDEQPERPCFAPLPQRFERTLRPMLYLAAAGGFTLRLVPLESGASEGEA